MYDAGFIVLCSFISPKREMRQAASSLLAYATSGMYKKALAGKILNFTGIGSPYEEPENAELVVDTNKMSILEGVARVLELSK